MSYHRVDLEGPIGTEGGRTLYRITTFWSEHDVARGGHESIAYTDDPLGKILKWTTNDAVVPQDIMDATDWAWKPEMDRARDEQTAEFLAAYREAQARRTPEQIAEERFEMMAAFGPGETVVNVITGEKTKL